MRTFLALASVVILAAVLLAAGCQSGPGNGTLFGSNYTPTLPANATFNGRVVPPPATGSFAAQPQFAANGFGGNGFTSNGFTTPNAGVAAANSTQSPFWQRYQPLSLSTTNTQPAAGFNATTIAPPSGFGPAPGFQNPTPTSFATNNAPNGVTNPTNAPLVYAGNNPLLAWANRFNNYLFSSPSQQPGQWQSWSGTSPAIPATTTNFNSSTPTGFAPTSYSPPPQANNAWQNRPEPRSLRTADTYAPEPPVKIPGSALAGSVDVAPRSSNGGIGVPPPNYPARANAATQPAAVPAAPLVPRNTINAARSLIASDPAWPEITSLPKR